MKIEIILVLFISLLLNGCETGHGYERKATIDKLPDLLELRKTLESYPEIKRVDFSEKRYAEGRSFYFFYTDYDLIEGRMCFSEVEQNEEIFTYTHGINTFYPSQTRVQEKADATWPIIKKIENDLIDKLGVHWVGGEVKVELFHIEDPETHKTITVKNRH